MRWIKAGYFLYLISVLLALFKDLSDLFFFLGVNQHVMGGHMFVDLFLTPIKNAAVAVILISAVRPFAELVQFYW